MSHWRCHPESLCPSFCSQCQLWARSCMVLSTWAAHRASKWAVLRGQPPSSVPGVVLSLPMLCKVIVGGFQFPSKEVKKKIKKKWPDVSALTSDLQRKVRHFNLLITFVVERGRCLNDNSNKTRFCSFKGLFPENLNSMALVVPALGDAVSSLLKSAGSENIQAASCFKDVALC